MDEIKVGDIYKHNKYNDVYVILEHRQERHIVMYAWFMIMAKLKRLTLILKDFFW